MKAICVILAIFGLLAFGCDGDGNGTGQNDSTMTDTLPPIDTLPPTDTLVITDTLTVVDTVTVTDTLTINQVDTLVIIHNDTLWISSADTLWIQEMFRLPYIGRAEHRVEVGAKLAQNIAPTRMLPEDYVKTLTKIAVLTYETDEYFEFAWAFGDTIGWIDSLGSHVVVKRFLPDSTLKIIGWHIWDGVTVTEEYDLPINWEYVGQIDTSGTALPSSQ